MNKYLRLYILTLLMLTSANVFARSDVVDGGDDGESETSNKKHSFENFMNRLKEMAPYESLSRECGEYNQKVCRAQKKNGVSVCGRSVSRMVECMYKSISGKHCDAGGLRGKDFVTTDKLKKCGYKKVKGDSELCTKPGAVRAYSKTHTPAGSRNGHVEFVCGLDDDDKPRYCSIYKQVLDHSWPRGKQPDACWYPVGSKE